MKTLEDFEQIWLVDSEFYALPGEKPTPVCIVAREFRTGQQISLWREDLLRLSQPPYPIGPDALVVAYYASAELGCHLALEWSIPSNVLDLYAEFRVLTNGIPPPCGNGLVGALICLQLDHIGADEKANLRDLILRGGPWTPTERSAILDYCASDVAALERLLRRMAPSIDLPLALVRGRYMAAAARIERVGVPIDRAALQGLQTRWSAVQDRLVARVDQDYGIYEGRTFRAHRFEAWLTSRHIHWPRLSSGALALDDDTFREMARIYPSIAPLRELRVALGQMRLNVLSVGADGRNRALLSAFRAQTGRNQPSNTKSIFGPAVFQRGLIRPEPGWGIAYIDWEQQEFGIAAALSGDSKMTIAYESGDPYLAFAQQAGAVPPDATKRTHGVVRDLFKVVALAVQYGMGEDSLARRIGVSGAHARELLRLHHETYPLFWRWSDAVVDHALLYNCLHTTFGWMLHIGPKVNPRSLRNFPMQANGAEMLRLACCFATERGIRVCAPVHDALLIEAPLDELEQAVATTRVAMADASAYVLDGFKLRTEVKTVRYPDRYMDERGAKMWATVWQIIEELSQ